MNLESLLVTDNQTRGTPTLAGANENGLLSTTNSIVDLFGKAADVVTGAKSAWDGSTPSGATQSEPGQTTQQKAQSFLSRYGLWLGVGAALVIGFLFFTRR